MSGARNHPDTQGDPGQAPEDPARRPGQPGADEPGMPSDSVEIDAGSPVPGRQDDRQIPLDRVRDTADAGADEPPGPTDALSDGSTRAGPV